MTPIRFALWAAVSTDAQAADDKYSLDEQQVKCRAAGLFRGWIESAGPYVVPGESRTRYVNLSDAERAIPPLRQLLDDAHIKLFDILIIYEFDRLRELLDPVARTLSHYGVQLFSVSQPLEPQSPTDYNPYASDTEFMLRGMNQIISRAAISNLRRKFQTQMPRRVLERGLPHMLPYGYIKPSGRETDRNAVGIPDPETSKHVIMMKDWLLAGKSGNQIAADMNALGIPPPTANEKRRRKVTHWNSSSICSMLANPFYAGWVRWGRSKSKLDPRTGESRRIYSEDPRSMVTARGHHTPLWDDDTHAAILAEFKRRRPSYRDQITTALRELLRCSICGAMLWRDMRGRGKNRGTAWKCSKGLAAHMIISDKIVIKNLASRIITDINRTDQTPDAALATLEKQIADLKTVKARIGDGYLSGLFDLTDSTRRSAIVDAQLTALEKSYRNQQTANAKSAIRQEAITALRQHQDSISAYFDQADPKQLNKLLNMLYTSITVNPTGEIIATEFRNS